MASHVSSSAAHACPCPHARACTLSLFQRWSCWLSMVQLFPHRRPHTDGVGRRCVARCSPSAANGVKTASCSLTSLSFRYRLEPISVGRPREWGSTCTDNANGETHVCTRRHTRAPRPSGCGRLCAGSSSACSALHCVRTASITRRRELYTSSLKQ